jgi:FAD/FMN-containing dehydrogenase
MVGVSRRAFLGHAVAAIALAPVARAAGWRPTERVTAAATGCVAPPALPSGLEPYRQAYENWERDLHVDEVWSVAPRTADDVVALADWAVAHGWRLRAKGGSHSWAPLTVLPEDDCSRPVLLLDTTTHLTRLAVSGDVAHVEPGISLDALAAGLLAVGKEISSIPTTGTLTLGGILAVGAHGCVAGANGEGPGPGVTFGSVAALVRRLTAVVWDDHKRRHVLLTVDRQDPRHAVLVTALGRTFVTEVELEVAPARTMRCVSRTDVPASTLFGALGPDAFATRVAETGRVEVLWYPYTEGTWIKEWTHAPTKPAESKAVTGPYNYPFTEQVPGEVADLASQVMNGVPAVTPVYTTASFVGSAQGLLTDQATDLWGASSHLYLHHEGKAFRVHEAGYSLLTSRARLQEVVRTFVDEVNRLLQVYALRDEFPLNGPTYVRATSVDRPVPPGKRTPALAAMHPHPDHPQLDTVVWVALVCFPGTPSSDRFFAEMERFCRVTFQPPLALARSEWAKGYAYDGSGGWRSAEQLAHLRETFPDFATSRRRLDELDPHRVFSNTFVDAVFG